MSEDILPFKSVTPRSELTVKLPDGAIPPKPQLLRIPSSFQSVDDVLGTAAKMDLPNILVLSELPNGSLVFLDSGMSMAECNWLLDRLKGLMLAPDQPMRPE